MKKFLTLLLFVIGSLAFAQERFVQPGDNLIVEGIPPIPESIINELYDYTESRSTGFRAWHPVSREMIVTTRSENTSQLHKVDSPMGNLTQLTFEKEPVRSATYEPVAGNYFLFMKDDDGNEFSQIYRYNITDGAVTPITSGERVQNSFPAWSNKGDLIAYTSTKRNGADRDYYVMNPLDSSTNKMILERTGGGWGVRDWSPDDNKLLISEFVSSTESHYYLLDIETGELNELTEKYKGDAYFSQGVFDADGKGVYLVTNYDSEFERVAYLDITTKELTFVSEKIPWDVDEIEISKQGDKLAFITNEAGESNLYIIDLPSGTPRKIESMPKAVFGSMEFHNNGNDLALSVNSARSSTDVYVLDVNTGDLNAWTKSDMGGIIADELSIPELIRWNSFDGLEITGFYYKPPASFTGKRPVIIDIHGGPEGQSRPRYLGFQNYFINELGIAVIFPNVRGSTGFGKSFLNLDNGMNRENSVKDIGALLDWIAQQPELDADRVMVTGGSYGGYMSLAVSVHYSDRIRCAIDVVGISNFNTFLKNTESYRRDLRRVEYGDERDPEMYAFLESISPLNNADKIRNPILIVQGSNDPRVPRTEAEQMKDVIKANGGEVWYLEAKDEGHGFAKKNNADFLRYVSVMFAKEFLLKEDTSPQESPAGYE